MQNSILLNKNKYQFSPKASTGLIVFSPLPHHKDGTWVDFEYQIALRLLSAVRAELQKITLSITSKKVHKLRVSLRRWFSLWSVLKQDSWETKPLRRNCLQPLKKLQKQLGKLRDVDVNIEVAKKFGSSSHLLKKFKNKQKKHKKEVTSLLKSFTVETLVQEIESSLFTTKAKLAQTLATKQLSSINPFHHFNLILKKQEHKVKELSCKDSSPQALHKLRLAVKKWRYLLTDCLEITNDKLVLVQQVLGEIHDLDRLILTLETTKEYEARLHCNLKIKRKKLLTKLAKNQDKLPYGLRPGIASFKAQSR